MQSTTETAGEVLAVCSKLGIESDNITSANAEIVEILQKIDGYKARVEALEPEAQKLPQTAETLRTERRAALVNGKSCDKVAAKLADAEKRLLLVTDELVGLHEAIESAQKQIQPAEMRLAAAALAVVQDQQRRHLGDYESCAADLAVVVKSLFAYQTAVDTLAVRVMGERSVPRMVPFGSRREDVFAEIPSLDEARKPHPEARPLPHWSYRTALAVENR